MPGRILIVDDDPEMRDLFREVLELDAHEVLTAGNPEEALALDCSDQPQVVLVDAALAEAGDIASLGKRFERRWPQGEVVYLADASDLAVARRLERGRIRHFMRPFQIEELRDLVSDLLERQALTGR